MLPIVLFLIAFLTAYGKEVCPKVENDTEEPYLSYALLRTLEKALLELGYSPVCREGREIVFLKVINFEEKPIAITPEQRVSSYLLTVSLSLKVKDEEEKITSSVPYRLPYGGLGDIPRREAVDDLVDKIYTIILKSLRRLEDADKRGNDKNR